MFKNPLRSMRRCDNPNPNQALPVNTQDAEQHGSQPNFVSQYQIHVLIPDVRISDELRGTSTFDFLEHFVDQRLFFELDLLEVAQPAFAYVQRFEHENHLNRTPTSNLPLEVEDALDNSRSWNLPYSMKNDSIKINQPGRRQIGKALLRQTHQRHRRALKFRMRQSDALLSVQARNGSGFETSKSCGVSLSNTNPIEWYTKEASIHEEHGCELRYSLNKPAFIPRGGGAQPFNNSYDDDDVSDEQLVTLYPLPTTPYPHSRNGYRKNISFSGNNAPTPQRKADDFDDSIIGKKRYLPPARVARPNPQIGIISSERKAIDSLNEGSETIQSYDGRDDDQSGFLTPRKRLHVAKFGIIGDGRTSRKSHKAQSYERNRDVDDGFKWQQLYPNGVLLASSNKLNTEDAGLGSSIFQENATHDASLTSPSVSSNEDTISELDLNDPREEDERPWWASLIPGADKPGMQDALKAVYNGDGVTRKIAMARRVFHGYPRNLQYVPMVPPTPKQVLQMRQLHIAQNPPEFCDHYTFSPKPLAPIK